MSLSDRLDSRRRAQAPAAHQQSPGSVALPPRRAVDPFGAVKASVHQAMLESLGPQLYDPRLGQGELESRVRQTL